MKMKFKTVIFCLCVLCFQLSEGARILGIFPLAPMSHYSMGNSLLRGLAETGHDVTMISPHTDTLPTTKGSYRNIVLTGFLEVYESMYKEYDPFTKSNVNSFTYLQGHLYWMDFLMNQTFQHSNVKTLLNSDETFDIVVVDQTSTEAFKYFAYHFKAHLVLFSIFGTDSKINKAVGNPTMISYVPQLDTDFSSDMSLFQKILNFLLYTFEALIYQYSWLPSQDRLLQSYFPGAPSIFELNYNVSLVLINSHESIQPSIPLVPNIIPIGGFHVKKPKTLPKDLQEYLDDATDGVIYASFGSSVKTITLPIEKREALLKTFGNVKEKVLWKWEGDNVENLPSNVKIGKWFPQKEILAHPNVKLFITQGGILSLTETVSNGVPVLVIPIFADQTMNAQFAVLNEYGLCLSIHDPNFSAGKLTPMVKELLNNPKFKENALKRSQIYHDREIDPLQKAIYWIEYIIRHNGAPHLRVWGTKLPWYQHYSLDVISILIISFCIIFIFVYNILRILLRLVTKMLKKKKDSKVNRKIKNN